ncbi:NAD(P)-dependent oxidoreductase [Halobacteriovorax sp. HLS]|uniref:NAD-dependent epimerase/dehydratase family protein n=1 Tax=Halobacteriovorax sp. HLS TaxID=2234000 RepID=UPI000FDA6B33|nr:NAD-dependent epimerase/dehydratase family protein [Halobacteriovorax sp. HLS]
MKVLVTGATGFVGSHLTDQLTEQGHEVFSLIRSPKKAQEFDVKGTYIEGSLSSSGENSWLEKLPSDLDAVVHTAGIVHSMDTSAFYEINAECTKQLILDLVARYNKLNFTLISSLAAVGPSGVSNRVDETSTPAPVSEYGRSKLKAENYLVELAKDSWVSNIVRPPMVIGPRDPAVLDVFKMIKSGLVVTAGMQGTQNEYSFVCVYDLVDCIIKTLSMKNSKIESYFASYPEKITLDELYKTIKKLSDKKNIINVKIPAPLIKVIGKSIGVLSKFVKLDIRLTPDKVNELLPNGWVCNSTKSQQDLAKEYDWDLERTIQVTFSDYKTRNWL